MVNAELINSTFTEWCDNCEHETTYTICSFNDNMKIVCNHCGRELYPCDFCHGLFSEDGVDNRPCHDIISKGVDTPCPFMTEKDIARSARITSLNKEYEEHGNCHFSSLEEMTMYFEQWFSVIPFEDVRKTYSDGKYHGFLALYPDGSDAYLRNGTTEEDIVRLNSQGVLFGTDK